MQVALSKTKVSNVLYYWHTYPTFLDMICPPCSNVLYYWHTYPTPINSSYIKDFYNSISKINRNLLSFDFTLDNFTKTTVKNYLKLYFRCLF